MRSAPLIATLALVVLFGCSRGGESRASGDDTPAVGAAMLAGGFEPPPAGAPKLGVVALKVLVHERPSAVSRKLGYLSLGAVVARSEAPAGSDGCPGGWYGVHPHGFVCAGAQVTLDLGDPILRAASVRPDVTKPLPYAYGFVRAIAPLYLRVPTKDEQFAAEFGLDKHLDWWKSEGLASSQVSLGANDVVLDARGAILPGAPERPSTQLTQGELFGGRGDGDPPPFWLQGGARLIPNVSAYKVPKDSYFANRVRRHAGLAFVGSFATGPESLGRAFAVTTDLRIVPTSKVKPETASAYHGVEMSSDVKMPFAFVRTRDAFAYRVPEAGKPVKTTAALAYRSIVRLTGKVAARGRLVFHEAEGGGWVSSADGAFIVPPERESEWPAVAGANLKWIEISIENQTLVLWEGKRPVYATLVSTGRDGMADPKTSNATVRGTFRIRHKHVTTTMDSNGKSSEGGDGSTEHEVADDGAKKRHGEGTFELRDVPWVQYFEHGYALHAAYWHDAFGAPRSHGCVNLSPIDAHRVFQWTDPPVPPGWHGAIVGPDVGTTVVIHK